jgi:hypothetical protein
MSDIRKYTTSVHNSFISMQISYSTADVEKSLFTGTASVALENPSPSGNIELLVVDGDVFILQESSPEDAVPLTPGAGITGLVAIDKQE